MDARLATLEQAKKNRGSILPSIVFTALVGMAYVALAGLAKARGMSDEDVQAYSFSCIVVSLVSMLVFNYAAIM